MDKLNLEKLVNEGNSSYQIADILNKSQTTVRYWLKKYKIELKSRRRILLENGYISCCKCRLTKPEKEFFLSGKRISSYCKKCHVSHHYETHTLKKKELIKYKGGKCINCNLESNDENYVVFDFHHLDPSKKEMSVKVVNKGLDKLKKEADKCMLLCSNCHRLEHKRLFNSGI